MTGTTTAPTASAQRPRATSTAGLLRSIAHRLAGDDDVLPDEGHLPSFDGATRLAQLGAADARGAPRARRARRLLDLHLRQLAADRAVRPGLGREVPRRRADRRRRAHPGVRVRARPRQRDRRGRAASASSTRSRSTATTGSGTRSPTTTGRRSTSRTPRAASATTTSARASTPMTEMVDPAAARRRGRRRTSTRTW